MILILTIIAGVVLAIGLIVAFSIGLRGGP